jgi:uncharacterized protein YehS (DUF1456 family)
MMTARAQEEENSTAVEKPLANIHTNIVLVQLKIAFVCKA